MCCTTQGVALGRLVAGPLALHCRDRKMNNRRYAGSALRWTHTLFTSPRPNMTMTRNVPP